MTLFWLTSNLYRTKNGYENLNQAMTYLKVLKAPSGSALLQKLEACDAVDGSVDGDKMW